MNQGNAQQGGGQNQPGDGAGSFQSSDPTTTSGNIDGTEAPSASGGSYVITETTANDSHADGYTGDNTTTNDSTADASAGAGDGAKPPATDIIQPVNNGTAGETSDGEIAMPD